MLAQSDRDVISCGFAFPTLDGLPSLPFAVGLATLPHGSPAIVAPTGNESTACPYWPAAHSRVIGVASTNAEGTAPAGFSNWGSWADCCARGAEVVSTFLDFTGFPDDYTPHRSEAAWQYRGWASWNGTSFATPKVAAAIARVHAEHGLAPQAAYEHILAGHEPGIRVSPITGLRGVVLPHLHLG